MSVLAIAPLTGRNSRYVKYVALAGSLASLALLPFVTYGATSFVWLSMHGVVLQITSSITPINMMLLSIILLVAPIILAYSFGYMRAPSEQRRFYAEMLIFEAAMLTFSIAGDFITMFIAWEFLSLMSYLLIGFWHKRPKASRAARKAITIVLMGDICILAAMVLVWSASGSFAFSLAFAASAAHSPAIVAAAVLLAIAVMTKSAQFPFQEWLPDAMEGPTPVSAFLHSTTMVKAGVFVVVLMYPLFHNTGMLGALFAVSAVTVVLSTMNAMKETQIKRVIAYSTVQELGLMIFAASGGAILACIYFFLVQSFYKALLFFSAGSAMTATGKEDLNEISGMRSNRLVYVTTLVGVLSLAGFLPFSGFFSNIGLGSSFYRNLIAYAFISTIGLSTSFFIFRWLFLSSKSPSDELTRIAYLRLPRSMVIAMVMAASLALLSIPTFFYVTGFIEGHGSYLAQFIGSKGLGPSSYYDPVIETVMALAGAAASYYAYSRRKALRSPLLSGIAHNAGAVNAAYAFFAFLITGMGEGIAAFDSYLSTAFDDIGRLTVLSGRAIRRASVGSINIYLAIFSIALVVAFSYAYLFGGI